MKSLRKNLLFASILACPSCGSILSDEQVSASDGKESVKYVLVDTYLREEPIEDSRSRERDLRRQRLLELEGRLRELERERMVRAQLEQLQRPLLLFRGQQIKVIYELDEWILVENDQQESGYLLWEEVGDERLL